MRFDPVQLETLLTIVEEGSFDAAAGRLHLTPSAVSQRIKALETSAGAVLLRRATPTSATESAVPLLQLARQIQLLGREAEAALDHGQPVRLAVAVNADSLSGWFRQVLAEVARAGDVALELHVEDETWSHRLLRDGTVVAAVTSEPSPVQGCSVEPLGSMRFTPVATPDLIASHRRGRAFDWARAPMVVFNEKDSLQDDLLGARGLERPPVVHRVPSSADFCEAVRLGLGWGMLPAHQSRPAESAGELAVLPGGRPVDVPLFWQRWRLASPSLAWLTERVHHAAVEGLDPARTYVGARK